jgi:deoxycytidine triphosphate deaminase
MISRAAIKYMMSKGLIQVTPAPVKIGPNSIDLCLGDTLKMYHPTKNRVPVTGPDGATYQAIDPKNPPPLIDVPHPIKRDSSGFEDYWLLVPGQFYLGVTKEETYCRGVVPHLDGRSTCGRLSIEAHKTAGVGDNGFQGRWTLEIEATEPVILRPGARLFQVYFTPCWGEGLAYLIHSKYDGTAAWINDSDPNFISVGPMMGDGEPSGLAPLLELDDLYGKDGSGHHYQMSNKIRGAAPLD